MGSGKEGNGFERGEGKGQEKKGKVEGGSELS